MATEKNGEGVEERAGGVRGRESGGELEHLGPETLGKWGACIHYGSNE